MTSNWTIDAVKDALAGKKISARELLADFYKRIEAKNPELNAYLALTPERARRQADRIDSLFTSDTRAATVALEALVAETLDLIDQHTPDVDTAKVRATIGRRHPAWGP